jgi:heme oxygenase
MRYVVEGAQLGSRVIQRSLREAFGPGLGEFGSFWTPDVAWQQCWPAVLGELARLETRETLAAAARAARLTFRHMELCLAVREGERF